MLMGQGPRIYPQPGEGLWFQVSGFGFRVQDSRSVGFDFGVLGSELRISSSVFEFRVNILGARLGVPGFEVGVEGFGLEMWG